MAGFGPHVFTACLFTAAQVSGSLPAQAAAPHAAARHGVPVFEERAPFRVQRARQARGSGGFASKAEDDGIRDVSNVDRMGKDEVTLVNEMI